MCRQAYFTDVIETIGNHPINRIDELLPWNWLANRPTVMAA
ncbi:MAG: transposase domain-containing protein [Sphingomonadaceae bacterium]|nr:transposase domain-containing protein [Sphingomonadaceae bacterium]